MDRHLLIPGLEHIQAEPNWARTRDALLRKAVPDRVPFLEMFEDEEVRSAAIGRPIEKFDDIIEFRLRLGYDAVPLRISPPVKRARQGVEDTAEVKKDERSWAMASLGVINNRAEFEAYPWPDPDSTIPAQLEQAEKVLPEGMGILLQTSGVLENTMWMLSYERMCEALYDDSQFIKDFTDRIGNLIIATLEQGIDCEKVVGVFFGEDMGFKTSTMISPEHLRTYILPWHKKITDMCHKRGKVSIIHACGKVDEVMDDLIDEVGIDAKHSFEDVIEPVASAKRRYGRRIGIIGGVDMDVLGRASADEVAAYTRRVLEDCAANGGYALGSGNSIANYIPIENYYAMLKEGWKFRAK